MIYRTLVTGLISHLQQFPTVALLGPRQVGKTTLAKHLELDKDTHYLDLENLIDRENRRA